MTPDPLTTVASEAARFCTACGRPLVDCSGCGRELDPPRFCGHCGRRLAVVVTPGGFSARCRDHGATATATGSGSGSGSATGSG